MVFSSVVFLTLFLPLMLGFYFLAQEKLRNAVLLAGSLFFYAWGEPKAVFVMLILTAVSWAGALRFAGTKQPEVAKIGGG